MEIPDPPDREVCASCMSRLHWAYSLRRGKWMALIGTEDRTWRVHDCDRRARLVVPPNDEFRKAREALRGIERGQEQ